MSFPQLGYQYIRSIYPTEREEIGCDRPGTDLSPTGALPNVLSTMCASPFVAAQGYGAFLPYSNDLSIFNQLGTQFELKDTPRVQHPGFAHHPPTCYPYGQYQLGDPSRPKNATRESTSALKAWLSEHRKNPYPTKSEKIMLAILTKMTLTQVSTWFANARRRLKKENKMTWTHRSRTDEERNIYRCDHEGDERDMRDDDEEIDLENIDTENIENKGELDDQDDVPADLKLDVRSEADISDQRFLTAVVKEGNGIHGVRHDHSLQHSLEIKATQPGEKHLKLNTLSINPTSSENIAASAQKPKIWSLAETATAPDSPRSSPLIHRNPAETLAQTLIGHRRLLSCPFGKLQNWTNKSFSFHELSLLNSSHYLGLASQAFANSLVMYGRQAEERTHKSESYVKGIRRRPIK